MKNNCISSSANANTSFQKLNKFSHCFHCMECLFVRLHQMGTKNSDHRISLQYHIETRLVYKPCFELSNYMYPHHNTFPGHNWL